MSEPAPSAIARARALGVPALLVVAVAASAVPWAQAVDVDGTVAALGIAAAASVLLPVVAAWRRIGASATFALSGLALVVLVVVATLAAGGGLSELVPDLARTPARLLSETLPLTGPPGALALPVVLVWSTGAAAGELAARVRSAVAPTLPPVVGFAAAHTATAGAPPVPVAWAGALGLAVLGVIALRQAGADDALAAATRTATAAPAAGRRRLLVALAGAAAFAVAGTALASVAPTSRAEPAAPTREAPLVVPVLDDPIGVLAGLRRESPDLVLYELEVTGPWAGYVPIASLDRYDGDAWTFERTFVPTGGRVPLEAGAVEPGPGRVTAQVEVVGPGAALGAAPHLERVTEVEGLAADYDPGTGMIRPSARLRSGDRYRLEASVAPQRAERFGDRAVVGSPIAVDTAVPADLGDHLDRVIARLEARTGEVAAPTVAFLASVAEELRTSGRRAPTRPEAPDGPGSELDDGTPDDEEADDGELAGEDPVVGVPPSGGTSYAAVTGAVLARRQAQPEQFATLVALVARHLGVPARVVTGFRLLPLEPDAVAAEGPQPIRAEQAWTWVEVPVEGVGWVVLDPTPLEVGEVEEEELGSATTTSTTTPAAANAVPDPSGGHAVADPVELEDEESAGGAPWSLVVAAAVAGVALALALIRAAVVLLRRQRRRRHGSERTRTRAAWRELSDRLRHAGLGRLDAASASEVAEVVRQRFGPEAGAAAGSLAHLFNAATYTSAEPTEGSAAEAWAHQDVVQRSVARQVSRRRRLLAAWRRVTTTRRSARASTSPA